MSMYWDYENDSPKIAKMVAHALFLIVLVVAGCSFGGPYYNVWQQNLEGKAELAKATQNRQITVQEAQAKQEAAIELAKAEVERARGVAEANKIIGDSLKQNEDYLRYLWIDSLQNTKNQVIYVPTETNLPILEAGRTK